MVLNATTSRSSSAKIASMAGAIALAVVFSLVGASPALADPVGPGAPPVGGATYASFTVPGGEKNAAVGHVDFFGYIEGLDRGGDPNSIVVDLTCGATAYPVHIAARRSSVPSIGDAVVITRELPLSEVGHTCYVYARSKVASQRVSFAPTIVEHYWNSDRPRIAAQIITYSRNGGVG